MRIRIIAQTKTLETIKCCMSYIQKEKDCFLHELEWNHIHKQTKTLPYALISIIEIYGQFVFMFSKPYANHNK